MREAPRTNSHMTPEWRQKLSELFGLFLLFLALLLLLALFSFDADDPSLNHVVSDHAVRNKAGLCGAWLAGFLNDVFGVASLLCPVIFAALGAAYISPSYIMRWWRWCGLFLLTLCLLVTGAAWDFSAGGISGGGMVGNALHNNASRYLSPAGSTLLWLFVLLTGLQLALNISWFSLAARSLARLQKIPVDGCRNSNTTKTHDKRPLTEFFFLFSAIIAKWRDRLGNIRPAVETLPDVYDNTASDTDEPFPAPEDIPQDSDASCATGCFHAGASADARAGDAAETPDVLAEDDNAQSTTRRNNGDAPIQNSPLHRPSSKKNPPPLPGLDLLAPLSKISSAVQKEDREGKGNTLIACLKDFDIQGELVRITPGPVVTMYEVRPAPGIRVSRIANLSDDLALALKAMAIRIQAPIPGSDVVGIEIPNDNRENVNFRELAATENFRKGCGPLTMILGKDIAGRPYIADLTRMPHLLVAGATGAGKSVCLNSILISLLYRTQPQEMQFLLIDPKRIEMAVYINEPHLVHPVVTDMNEAKNALDWAIHEMDRRYKALERFSVRNVAAFNQKLSLYKNELPPDCADLEKMPYLVIVIDELADLMLTAAREVETSIVRLAQLARAAGIHMILATQRPSVDVVTGLIKANFPCRISFQVTSKHDSRTILDQVGAEHLLGQGDMLFKPSSGRLQRLHGPFLRDDEVQAVVDYWKRHLPPSYRVDFAEWSAGAAAQGQNDRGDDASGDALYQEVQAFVSEQGRASISLVQRRFKIGFNRAARLVEQLEKDGIIGPADGSKPRPVVR